jgi:phosphonate transport system substrate-binding protein
MQKTIRKKPNQAAGNIYRHSISLFTGLILSAMLLFLPTAYSDRETFSVSFSSELFSDVNEADALASIRVWADTILNRRGLVQTTTPTIFTDQARIRQNLQEGSVDLVGLMPPEFFQLEDTVALDHLHFTSINGSITEEFLLLVRRDSGIETMADLQHKKIALVDSVRMQMSTLWLETLLLEKYQMNLQEFFGSVRADNKSSRAVLSTFFRQTEACLVSQNSFKMMVELNPQLGKQLHTLEISPAFIPALLCFRSNYDPELKKEVLAGMHALENNISGQQILMVFGAERLVAGSLDDLLTTRRWYERHLAQTKKALSGSLPAAGKVLQ